MKDYNTLRKQYTDFIYHGWKIDETDTSFTVTYIFEIVGLQSFHPTFTLPKPAHQKPYMESRLFKEAVFSLGMVELISYWKITAAPKVHIACGCTG